MRVIEIAPVAGASSTIAKWYHDFMCGTTLEAGLISDGDGDDGDSGVWPSHSFLMP